MHLFFLLPFAILLSFYGKGKPLPKVKMITTYGEIIVEVDTLNAPVIAKNFLFHVSGGTYEEVVFYRTVHSDNQSESPVKIDVIQGGLLTDEKIAQHKGICHETTLITGLQHHDGTISMARSEPGTASTEFFICIGDQPELDFQGRRNPDGQGFAAFGKVIEGMDVVREIQRLPQQDQYIKEPVRIEISIKKE